MGLIEMFNERSEGNEPERDFDNQKEPFAKTHLKMEKTAIS